MNILDLMNFIAFTMTVFSLGCTLGRDITNILK